MFNNFISEQQAFDILHTLSLAINYLLKITVVLLICFTLKFIYLLLKHIYKEKIKP